MLEYITDFMEKFGSWGLFIHSFLDAIFFPIPAFFTQVSLSLANPSTAIWLATVGYVACLLGTPFGYYLGKIVGESFLYKIMKKKWVDSATALFNKNGETAVLVGAFTPIPFKVFTVISGFLKFPLWKLIAYALLGRAVKFYAVGILFYLYGRAAEGMLTGVTLYIFGASIPIGIGYWFIKRIVHKRREQARVAHTASTELGQESAEVEKEQASTQAMEPIDEAGSALASEQISDEAKGTVPVPNTQQNDDSQEGHITTDAAQSATEVSTES